MNLSDPSHHLFRGIISIIALLAIIAGGTLGLPRSAQASPAYVLDSFTTAAYTNQNGTASWAANWIETNDDGSATTGDVLITGGELRLNNTVAQASFESIERELNMPVNATATLTYNHRDQNLVAGDTLILEVYDGDTAAWTTLETFNGNIADGPRAYDISSYRSASTRIRFRISAGFTAANKFFYADNVRIDYWSANTHGSTSVFPTVQTYYIPVPEDQGLLMLDAVNAAAVNPMILYASITVNAKGTVIYYDHWEDGFETEIANPQQNTSEVWGDDNPANGIPPGYTTDRLNAGSIIILNNQVTTTSPGLIDFDGGDKIASTNAIAVTRTSWASGSGTLHGGSVEMLDTSIWGTRYDIPADAGDQANDFDYAGLAVMASQANTRISLNGTLVATINEGQSYLFNDTVNGGDQITASAPIQANFLTGDIGSNYESSWYTLYPFDLLSSSYYAPVDSTGAVNTAVFIQNPNAASITVHWTTTAGAQADIGPILAGATARVIMPNTGTGARFYTGTGLSTDPHFQAISAINSGGQDNDWGYTLIPANQLTQQAMVGWGVGRDPTSTTNPTENGSPIWVTAVGSGTMNVCADYNGDRAGALTDANGSHYDRLLSLTNLARAKVYDTDGDQTGMLLYLCNGSESANGKGNKIAVAWGQDPATASPGAPGLDVGTSVPPLPNFTSNKNARLIIDLNSDTLFDVGETFEYQIEVNNVGALPIPGSTITVSDIIPHYTLYVPNSTSITDSGTGLTTAIPDESVPPKLTAFPLDEGGYRIPQQLGIDKKFTVTFRVKIDASLPGLTRIQNNANVSGLDLTYVPTVEILVQPPDLNSRIGDTLWLDQNGDGIKEAGEPGLPGVTVELHDGACIPNSTCLTDVTDASGEYGFPNLINNTYTVVVKTGTLPDGLTQTGDPDGAFDNQHTIVLTNGNKPYLTADFGYQGNVSIGDFVWHDIDRDGIQDGDLEVGLGGVTVNLTWAGLDGSLATTSDNLSVSTVTNSAGAYDFNSLPAGSYQVNLDQSTLPANHLPTTTNPLVLGSLDAGKNITTADFGAAPGATIGDRVWNDMNNNAAQDAGESGISGVRVYIDANGNGVYDGGELNATTDANGRYTIPRLSAGTYTVRVDAATVPAGYYATTAQPLSAIVATGQNYVTADFGYRVNALSISKTSSAGGQVRPDDTITYTVSARNNSGANQTGMVISDLLPAGTAYTTQSTRVDGYVFSSVYYSDDFQTGVVYNGSGAGSAVWGSDWTEVSDNNNPNTGYIRVRAADANCPGGSGNCLRFTAALASLGIYRQANLSTCSSSTLTYAYRNSITSVAALAVRIYTGATLQRTLVTYSSANAGNSTASFILNPGELAANTRVSFDLTAVGPNTVASRIYFDNILLTCNVFTATTKDTITGGTYQDLLNGAPPNLVVAGDNFGLPDGQSMTVTYRVRVNNPVNPPGLTSINNTAQISSTQQATPQQATTTDTILAVIGDLVWTDTDMDGVQDTGESGLPGVVVNLLDGGGNQVDSDPNTTGVQPTTRTTNAGGLYSFTVPAGTYIVEFVRPAGYAFSPGDQGGDDTRDSDANTTTGRTAAATAAAGATNATVDAGLYQYAVISDFIWNDLDGDGAQDGGSEVGLAGVRVYVDQDHDNTYDVGEPTGATAAGGLYSISNLAAGTYDVRVDTTTLPAGYSETFDLDGIGTLNRASIIVTAGQIRTDVDFGYQQQNAVIGDFVWNDLDGDGVQDGGSEAGLVGVRVHIDQDHDHTYDVGEPTALTNGSGHYSISGLAAGTHDVRVDTTTLPAGYSETFDLDGISTLNEANVTITAGQTRTDVDFGYRQQNGVIGDFIWNDLDRDGVQDGGLEVGLSGVRVYVDSNSNNIYDTGEPAATSNAGGLYSLTGLPPGTYDVRVDMTTLLTGYGPTYDLNGDLDSEASVTLTAGQTRTDVDFGFSFLSLRSDCFVWLDEDGNGHKDAGEVGIPNVRVTLTGTDIEGHTVSLSTFTDTNGRYIFIGLSPSSASGYAVTVDSTTLPGGLAGNPTYDSNGIGTAHTTTFVLNAANAHPIPDFGYNWAAAGDTNGNTGIGAIGDRLWIDANGDGRQDTGEAGLAAVSVALLTPGADGSFGTADDVTAATTTSDAAGNYIFDGLAAGAYVVSVNGGAAPAGYTQTGDPDHFGATGANDNLTTTPILLAPGDVYLNADFGYRPTGGSNTISDQIFIDADGNGAYGGSDYGIAGVSVALLANNGQVMATTVTDGNGQYSFTGLPDGAYTVWVNDARYVLGRFDQSSTPDNAADGGQPCGVCNGRNTVTVSGAGNAFQDFGYAPANHDSGDGLIGDTIFLDANSSGTPDAGEGLEGVIVQLYNAAGTTLLASTTTNENGQYFIGHLPAATYVVRVAVPTPAGYTNTADPDGGTANESTVTLGAGGINLTQDFGYRGTGITGTIGSLIWNDLNADGHVEAGEAGLDGVTVELYRDLNANGAWDTGDNIVGTTTTSGGGAYSFSGLASDDGGGNAQYLVHVTDENGVLTGWWAARGTAGVDNNSQADPYVVTLTPASPTNTTADFGYYRDPAGLGNLVWLDRNSDGLQAGASEPGIAGVKVTLTITWPGGAGTSTLATYTDAAGYYSFGNLLADEDFDGAGADEPVFSISVTAPAGTSAAPQNTGSEDLDSDNPTGQSATVLEGTIDNRYDFGFCTTRLDLGDAPDAYQTRFGPGAAHIVFPDGGDGAPDTTNARPAVWLGATVDVEQDGQPSADAKADGADEDGLTFKPSGWMAGNTSVITVTLNASESGVTVYFGLWIDWNQDNVFEAFYAGSGVTGSPVAVPVNVSVPVAFTANRPVYFRVRAHDAPLNAADSSGTKVNGEVEDYQLTFSPTAVNLAAFTAAQAGDHNAIAWETVSELHNLGFNLWRGLSADAPTVKLNDTLIPSQAPGGTDGCVYGYDDFAITNGDTYWYWLEDVDLDGTVTRHGPVSAAGDTPTAVTLTGFAASSPPPIAAWPLLGFGAIGLAAAGVWLRRRK